MITADEALDLSAATGNPTGGIHTKLVLVKIGGETWTALGSLNGGEVCHKINREVVLLVDQPMVYARLQAVFLHDWELTTRDDEDQTAISAHRQSGEAAVHQVNPVTARLGAPLDNPLR